MLKLLGIGDIIASILLFLTAFSINFLNLPEKLVIAFAIYLLIKALIFFMSWISIIDLAAGILLFLSIHFALPKLLVIIVAILLLQKGLFSIVS